MLCKGCVSGCRQQLQGIEIECTQCKRTGCKACDGKGYFTPPECPKKFCGQDVFEAISLAAMAEKYGLPCSGGLLDQSNWFYSLLSFFRSECSQIELETLSR
jgi:hypothetical protein